jgi:hypothetical protein
MGTAPRVCHPIDNETIQVSDDVIEGGPFDWSGGHVKLSQRPGHGLRLDAEHIKRYRYKPSQLPSTANSRVGFTAITCSTAHGQPTSQAAKAR